MTVNPRKPAETAENYDKYQAAYEQAKASGARWVWAPSTKEQMRARWIRPNVDMEECRRLAAMRVFAHLPVRFFVISTVERE